MFIDKNSIIINNVSMGQYLTQVTYGYNKLWGDDTGRNLAGVMTGTFIGVFPKITLQFRKLTKSEVELLVPILDAPTQTLTYYDPFKKQATTITTYTNDYNIVNNKIINAYNKNKGFSVSFTARSKRV